jgi:hypothetical protein
MGIKTEELTVMVRELWPRYTSNLFPMWQAVISQYEIGHVQRVLREHRAHNPDEARPIWKMIYADLSGSRKGDTGMSMLQALLISVRASLKERGRKGHERMTDEEVYLAFLDAQCWPILRNSMGRERPDPGGKIARRAAIERYNVSKRYHDDLVRRGHDVPSYLVLGDDPHPPIEETRARLKSGGVFEKGLRSAQ